MHQQLGGGKHHQKIVETHDFVNGSGKLVDFVSQVGCEQRTRHHIQGEVHHVGSDIALLARTPEVANVRCFFHHDRAVLANALAMKSRLRGHALRAMHSPFRRDHAFAEKHFGALHGALFDEVIVLHHQQLADVLGMVQKNDMVRPDLVMRDVTVGIGQMLKERNGISGTKLPEGEP